MASPDGRALKRKVRSVPRPDHGKKTIAARDAIMSLVTQFLNEQAYVIADQVISAMEETRS